MAYKPRPKAGVFKPTAKEKAILTKTLPSSTKLPRQRTKPVPGVFKLTPAEKAMLKNKPRSR